MQTNLFRSRAFTLIELLVVIGIIAILAAMLLSVLARAKETGRKANCISNLHQMVMGMLLYADETDGFVPRGNEPYWWKVLGPTLGARSAGGGVAPKTRIFVCPSYPNKDQLIAYVVNAWTFRDKEDMNGRETTGLQKLIKIERPVDTAYFADDENGSWRPIITDLGSSGSDTINDVWSPDHLPYPATSTTDLNAQPDLNPQRRVAAARHKTGPDLGFFDGHAQWKRADKISVNDWRDVRY